MSDTDRPSGRGRDISLKLAAIVRQQSKKFAREVEGVGVTRSQWSVIVVVVRHPGATQRLIAEALDISEAAAGKVIDRLCSDGLLVRRAKADDRRARCVFLTDRAQPILDRLGTIGAAVEHETFRGIAPADLAILDGLLETIYRNVTS